MSIDPFQAASDALATAGGRVSRLAEPFLRLLPVSGASISTFGPLLGPETVSATDTRAGHVDELQFDLGEGPCWDALSTRRPVLEPDLLAHSGTPWPAFSEAIRDEGIGALFAFPLVFGPLDIGAVDLYSVEPVSLSLKQQRQTLALSAIVSRLLLRHAVDQAAGLGETTPFARREVHQATGMVVAQLGTKPGDAYLIIQARAFAEGRTMQQVARDVIERRVRFSDDPSAAGETP
jgi:hypothetical protein